MRSGQTTLLQSDKDTGRLSSIYSFPNKEMLEIVSLLLLHSKVASLTLFVGLSLLLVFVGFYNEI